ncbi:unnamed protein product [Microthlaspi erraticum]|uniref:non-specific serine/threonine protein kinase n=1 Tax=Microthlaspi erraticum TaxID=1685480 RepID=A0A6D2K693_9BRAS|nr:unnamed protein product [Microthlaspi erraticum]
MEFMNWGSSVLTTPRISMSESASRVSLPGRLCGWPIEKTLSQTTQQNSLSPAVEVFSYIMANMALCGPSEKFHTSEILLSKRASQETLYGKALSILVILCFLFLPSCITSTLTREECRLVGEVTLIHRLANLLLRLHRKCHHSCLLTRGSMPYYRSGPWAKTMFTGIPRMDETLTSTFIIQQDANLGSSSYISRNLKLSRLVLTSDGFLKRFQHSGTDWELTYDYESPANSCDHYGVCGPFGVCVTSASPKCKCFKGFTPKHVEKWKRGNWTDGCVRHTELLCQRNSTGKDENIFHQVANVKPPDFYEFVISVDSEDCNRGCLQNCSCLAFAYIRGIGCLIRNQELLDVAQFSKGGELLSIRLARSELGVGGNERNKTIAASVVSLSLFVILVYEYMVNKILDTFLLVDSRKRLELDWPKRFDIIQGIARGLLYLHRDSRLKVIHRDLKVSNILLDENMNPKISDFGLARMFQGTQNQDNTHSGYMSPEYAWTGMFSEKSDIYSFGVLLLEIISGEKISRFRYNEECKTLLAYAWESWCETEELIFWTRSC